MGQSHRYAGTWFNRLSFSTQRSKGREVRKEENCWGFNVPCSLCDLCIFATLRFKGEEVVLFSSVDF
jgi:hypothetical protein